MTKHKEAEAAPAPAVEPTTAAAEAAPAKPKFKVFNLPQADVIKAHRPDTKRAKVVELIKQPGGATFTEIMAATGWDDKTCYEGVRLVHQYLGYGMKTDPDTGKIVGLGETPPMLEKAAPPPPKAKTETAATATTPKPKAEKKLSKKAQAAADAAAAAAAAATEESSGTLENSEEAGDQTEESDLVEADLGSANEPVPEDLTAEV